MSFNIRAGMRVLYKDGASDWKVGELEKNNCTEVNEQGLWLRIIPREFIGKPEKEIKYIQSAEINRIFFDAKKLEGWEQNYPDYFMTKEQYADFVEREDFDKRLENAFVSDGEYIYYPVNKYTRGWIEKQPFDYVLRYE